MPTFQTIAILTYFWWLLSTFHIRINVSTDHTCFYNSFSCAKQPKFQIKQQLSGRIKCRLFVIKTSSVFYPSKFVGGISVGMDKLRPPCFLAQPVIVHDRS